MTLGLMHSKERGQGGLEPPTSRTRSENHTSRPLALAVTEQKILEPGIEPGTYCVLGSRHNQLDQPSIGNPGGTRTPNLEIRSLTPYPLGHEDMLVVTIVRTWGTKPRQDPGASGKTWCLEWGSNPRILSNT